MNTPKPAQGSFAWAAAFAALRSETKVSKTSFLVYGLCTGHIRPHQASSGHIRPHQATSYFHIFRYLDMFDLETLALFLFD